MMVSLKSLRADKNLSQRDLADMLGVSQSTVAMWELGTRNPSYTAFVKLSHVLGCSADTLMEAILEGDIQPNTTGDRLRKLRTDKGLSQVELGKRLGVTQSVITGWETDYRKPVRKLKELTALFGVTADYLMGLDETSQPEQVELPVEPAPPTREDVIQAFAHLLDVAEGYLIGKTR